MPSFLKLVKKKGPTMQARSLYLCIQRFFMCIYSVPVAASTSFCISLAMASTDDSEEELML